MSKNSKVLVTDIQLQCCITNEIKVEVWVKNYCDHIGNIVAFCDDFITVEDGNFIRGQTMIKAKEKVLKLV